tara:strand:- start:13528 stop:13770 length:243 start_codon:yes stop_codon:yes gene_type:complete
MGKLTEKELATVQGLVQEFNQAKIQLGDAVISQSNILKKVEELRVSYAASEAGLIKTYGEDATINIETGEVTNTKDKKEK